MIIAGNNVTGDHQVQQKKQDPGRQILFVLSHLQTIGLNLYLRIYDVYTYMYMTCCVLYPDMYVCMHAWFVRVK